MRTPDGSEDWSSSVDDDGSSAGDEEGPVPFFTAFLGILGEKEEVEPNVDAKPDIDWGAGGTTTRR